MGTKLGTATTSARAYSYNHLGQLTQVVDDAGTRTIGYNAYNEQESDSLLAGGKTHLVTELRDDYGRSSGYTYANNVSVQQTVSIGYGTDGLISSAGFVYGGAQKLFTYSYLRHQPAADSREAQRHDAHADLRVHPRPAHRNGLPSRQLSSSTARVQLRYPWPPDRSQYGPTRPCRE